MEVRNGVSVLVILLTPAYSPGHYCLDILRSLNIVVEHDLVAVLPAVLEQLLPPPPLDLLHGLGVLHPVPAVTALSALPAAPGHRGVN